MAPNALADAAVAESYQGDDGGVVAKAYANAGWLSRVTFTWVYQVVRLGYGRQLNEADLIALDGHNTTEHETTIFQQLWQEELQRPKPSLSRALWRQFRNRYFTMVGYNLSQNVIQLASPLLLTQLLNYLEKDDPPVWEGYALAAAFAFVPMVGSMFNQYSMKTGYLMAMGGRSLCSALVYDKTFTLSNSAWQNRSIGEIQNLMAFDAKSVGELVTLMPNLISSPINIVLILTLLGFIIGPSMLLGVAVMLFSFPISAMAFGKIIQARVAQSKFMDRRLKKLSEMLQGVRVLKYYAWETFFSGQVHELRMLELAQLRRMAILRAVTTFSIVGTPLLVTLSTFGLYTRLGNKLTPEVAFPSLLLFQSLIFPLTMLPMILSNAISLGVALKRLDRFMQEPERLTSTDGGASTGMKEGTIVSIRDAQFIWSERADMPGFALPPPPPPAKAKRTDANKTDTAPAAKEHDEQGEKAREHDEEGEKAQPTHVFALQEVTLEIRAGQLVVICGVVGSGKTSLLEAILGEMVKVKGSIDVAGSCAYAAQVPWIMNASVRDNVLFGQPYDADRYKKTLQAACLDKDLEMLPAGDATEIGERGINLSGGQKARVSLARACYAHSDLILMDDPLAAVDAHVGAQLADACIQRFLRDRTRLLVTNALHILPAADLVVVMKDGKVVEQGSYAELSHSGVELPSLLAAYGQDGGDAEDAMQSQDEGELATLPAPTRSRGPSGSLDVVPRKSSEARASVDVRMSMERHAAEGVKKAASAKLTQEEERAEGSVKLAHYLQYATLAGGSVFVLTMFLTYVVGQAGKDLSSLSLSEWTSATTRRNRDDKDDDDEESDAFYLGIYSALTVLSILASIGRSVFMAFGTTRASGAAHRLLMAAVFRAPTAFFDTTPTGRILNRFSKDTDTIDTQLPPAIEQGLFIVFSACGTFILIGVVLPWFFVPLVPILYMFFTFSNYFRPSMREVSRMESTTKSPIYNHFQETLNGLSTIRAFGARARFCEQNRSKMDFYNRSWWMIHAALNRWLGSRLELVGAAIIFATATLAVAVGSSFSGAGFVGVVLVYASNITPFLNFGVRQITEVEAKMTCFERIMEYGAVKPEAAERAAADKQLSTPWPSKGCIVFTKCSMRYRPDLELVLKNVSFEVQGGWKVGICGRTGAGKSSIMVGLFRMVELAQGTITVDGQDIAALGLTTLRESIVIMPQEAFLFAETVRVNIDPMGLAKDDAELWEVLKSARLDAFIRSLDGGLDAMVAENGDNFSVGQRQCLCMARALLRRPRILVLDEATASVDADTDQAIQRCIRSELAGCTCLTIAHRLHTIMDADRILLMEKGQVGEYDSPANLASKPGGMLSALIDGTGAASAAHLRRIATGEVSLLKMSTSTTALLAQAEIA